MISNKSQFNLLLGGRWAVSTRAALVLFPFVVLAPPLGNSATVANFPFAKWTLISLYSALPSMALYAGLHFSIYKNRSIKPLPWWGIVVFGAVLGGLKGFLMSYIGYKTGLVETPFISDVQKRMANHVLLGATLLPLVTLILAGYDRYSTQRNKLLRQALAQNSFQAAAGKGIRPGQIGVDARVSMKIQSDLAKTRAALNAFVEGDRELNGNQIANYLRDRARTSIRPLSHSLYNDSVNKIGSRRLRSALRWGVLNLEIYPDAILVIYGVTTIANQYDRFALLTATSNFATHILLLGLVLYGFRALARKFRSSIFSIKVLTAVGSIVIFEWAGNALLRLSGGRADPFANQVSEGIWILIIVLAVSGFMGVFVREEETLESLKSILTEADIGNAGDRSAKSGAEREMANYLHVHLQTSLINAANIIEQATLSGDSEAVFKQIDKLQHLLNLPETFESENPTPTLESTLRQAKKNWDGLMKIQTQIAGNKKSITAVEARQLGQTLDEALANAFRHGQATNVKVTIRSTDKELTVIIIDNGIGPLNGAEGLGSQAFDSIGGSNWNLKPGAEGGAEFRLTLNR